MECCLIMLVEELFNLCLSQNSIYGQQLFLSKIRLVYNNVYRKVLVVFRHASASGMFVSNDILKFEAFL